MSKVTLRLSIPCTSNTRYQSFAFFVFLFISGYLCLWIIYSGALRWLLDELKLMNRSAGWQQTGSTADSVGPMLVCVDALCLNGRFNSSLPIGLTDRICHRRKLLPWIAMEHSSLPGCQFSVSALPSICLPDRSRAHYIFYSSFYSRV